MIARPSHPLRTSTAKGMTRAGERISDPARVQVECASNNSKNINIDNIIELDVYSNKMELSDDISSYFLGGFGSEGCLLKRLL